MLNRMLLLGMANTLKFFFDRTLEALDSGNKTKILHNLKAIRNNLIASEAILNKLISDLEQGGENEQSSEKFH